MCVTVCPVEVRFHAWGYSDEAKWAEFGDWVVSKRHCVHFDNLPPKLTDVDVLLLLTLSLSFFFLFILFL